MKTCPNCQNPVNDGELFCPNCGTKVEAQQTPNVDAQQYNQPNYNQQQYSQQYSQQNYNQQQYSQQNYNQYGQQGYYQQPVNVNNTPMLIWAILNILFCCMPLGIWSLILSINANKKPSYEEAAQALKTAKTVNLVGTIGGLVFQIIYIIMMAVLASEGML